MNLYKALTMDITNKLPLRLRAAGWTAAVAALPAYAFAWFIAGPSGLGEFMRTRTFMALPKIGARRESA